MSRMNRVSELYMFFQDVDMSGISGCDFSVCYLMEMLRSFNSIRSKDDNDCDAQVSVQSLRCMESL